MKAVAAAYRAQKGGAATDAHGQFIAGERAVVADADRSETKIYDLVLFRNHSENSMTHISVMTHFLVRRVMCRIQLRITHPAFGWWGLLIYSSVYDDALPLCAPQS
jgi:hypothetical protein